jgi:lysophospholipase L1-like esterase
MLVGGICRYRHGSQLRAAESFLRSHRGQVAFVTISIGGNDVQRCGDAGVIAAGCAQLALAGLGRTMPRIARRLGRAAGDVPVVGLTYYNAFLALYLQGPAGQAQALVTVPLAAQFNASLRRTYRAHRIGVADVPRAFSSNELAAVEPVAGLGPQPVAVARICRWTWMCAPAPRGPDIHPNTSGYRVIARELGRVLR